MSQRHDTGHRKSNAKAQHPNTPIDGEALARDLIRRGLASPAILDNWHKPPQRTEQP